MNSLTRFFRISSCLTFVLVFLPSNAQEQHPAANPTAQPSRVRFQKVTINAASDFEAACAADINGDGKLDIVSGDTWYEAPNWTPHRFREIGDWGREERGSGYRRDFADLPVDVNADGRIDIVSSDYATGELFWHENPGPTGGLWSRHAIARPGSAETTALVPILDRRAVCLLPNCADRVVWYELRRPGPQPQWVEHVVGKEGAGHGIGWGDLNGDGKLDLITPHGWYEQVDAAHDRWIWHGDWQCDPGDLGIGTPVLDATGDRANGFVFGSGHHYGLYWMQQMPPNSPTRWAQHPIDTTWSQAHTLILADLEGNRHPVVVTGKRYKAHDSDVGANEPLGIYYYRYDRRQRAWQKYVIDQGTQAGTGLQMTAVDLRHTGRLDLICPGKSGLYVFFNEGRR